ncbi:TetR/AcrR family transcriptional regulator [Microbacterium sp. ASV49]|uniref:TetR/AcrR family transcriptional regulator n=1 Tax=Microbacterium candidum TaxID=3041922 RepID=A0ABT7MZP9_9MICO|nr:TetR/AcrR family transcriptional regulator [Microbacterium sp. ASV49]MDL9979930.1 TetR/AcrR family transcriptional regulator [Microbacterium sp. ASV49]
MGRSRLSSDERRAQLVALGVAALADRPLEDLTTELIAREAGVSRGLFAYYFGSRDGFHREVVRTAGEALLHATEPRGELGPVDRLRDTLLRLVAFVQEHQGTFFSLVRGTASGDDEVREIVERVREVETEHVMTVVAELGVPDSTTLRITLRSWVAFAEQLLIEGVITNRMDSGVLVDLLVRSLFSLVVTVEPEQATALSGFIH